VSFTYTRIVLKFSGEALAGGNRFGFSPEAVAGCIDQISRLHEEGLQICLVVGGGNIFRGSLGVHEGIPKGEGDYIGMMATVVNALMLQSHFRARGVKCRVFSSLRIDKCAELFDREKALQALAENQLLINAAGTGNPFFTTDSAAALRAAELEADALFKATQVDGVYDSDPHTNPDARKIPRLTYREAIDKQLGVMDASAFSLCMDNRIPIIIFKWDTAHTLRRCLEGDVPGSIISP
jgi:uridylate kinase